MNIDQLHFIRPTWLWALLPLVPVLVVLWRASRSSAAWQRVCDPHLLRHLLVKEDGRARRGPLVMLALGWIGAVAALAGPAWERLPQPSFRAASPTVVALELDNSMNATDVAPSRLERARFKVIDAFEREPDGQMGLVIYAEEPYVVTPITDDPGVVREMANVLATDLMPGRGARAERAIDESLALLEQAGDVPGRILLIADGAGDAPELTVAAARRAADAGHPVSVLAVGPAGHEDEGLRAVAEAGGGHYATLTADDGDLARALPEQLPQTAVAIEASDAQADTWRDMGAWLALLPLLLAPFAFRRTRRGALVALAALGAGASAQAQGVSSWFTRPDQRAAQAFVEGRYEEASEGFVDPEWRAAALYEAGRYDEAAELYGASTSPDRGYNLGNALARGGKLEEALAAYDELLAQNPEHADARFNRDLVQALLDQQQQEQQEQQQQEQQKDDSQSQDGQQPQDAQSQDGQQPQDGQPQDGGRETGEPKDARPEGGSRPPDSKADQASELEDREAGDQADELADAMKPQQVEPTDEPIEDGEPVAVDDQSPPRAYDEKDQATRQVLSRLPDDPGALLREKLRRRYLRRRYAPDPNRGW